jgi:chromosomal replication initiation ATPase DnaA
MILSPQDLARCEDIAALGAGKVKPIVDAVAEATGIQARFLYGHGRTARVAEARQLIYYLAHKKGINYSAIGRAMNRDHTTVIHGIRAEEMRRKTGEAP